MNGDLHIKDGTVTLPTIEELGYSKTDIQMFEKLIPDSITDVQGFLNYQIEGKPTVRKLSSQDLGTYGYAIETPNMYDGVSRCFTGEGGGQCYYAAFISDGQGHYWVLAGEQAGSEVHLRYASNHPKWQSTLPQAFREEVERMDVPLAEVEIGEPI
jgi:hypothetical protein